MEPNQRFTILPFPQFFDGKKLKINIVFLPRNQNPLKFAIEQEPAIPDAPPFAEAKLTFVAKKISGLSGLPTSISSAQTNQLITTQPNSAKKLFEILEKQFNIKNKGALNTNLNINNLPTERRAPDPVDQEHSVKKYLPVSYRKSFNFIAPRTENAVIDETYHCQVRGAKPKPGFKPSPEDIMWGQVFAHALRQPLLAKSLGMIFETELEIEPSDFPKGGWLYIDLADDSSYKSQQNKESTFIKRYAARIPVLEPTIKRHVFAALLFPVSATPSPGNYDELFIETATYDDGFAKIVHAFQPVSDNLLVEESDGFHPTKDVGIRLGWDDEQILIWYMRQLMEDPSVGPKKRIDAPLGVFGYRIDVREKTTPAGAWHSLNEVRSKDSLKIIDPSDPENTVTIGEKDKELELNYQVYPSQLDGDKTKNYWLPMYFANWNSKSMVLPDEDASLIYQNKKDILRGAPANNLNKIYETTPTATKLQYGKIYQFRVRFGDLSGGGPDSKNDPIHETVSQIVTCQFKRFVAPSTVRISNLPVNTEDYFEETELKIKRPLLGYPAVVFTGKYNNPVELLKQASENMAGKEAFGIADPDVDRVEITVELQTLKMDNLMSVSGKESYIKFYTTIRNFPKTSPTFEDELVIPIKYEDWKVLNFGNPDDLGLLGLSQTDIDSMTKLVLPTSRVIRLTIRPVCEIKSESGYYGLENDEPEFNTRYGRTIQFLLYKPSSDERDLFVKTSLAEKIQGIYLQPDPPFVYDGKLTSILLGKEKEKAPDMIQRLAQRLGLETNKMTLVGKKGERVQFGCSNRIRHTLSPDNSSLTFAGKGDLVNHWLCCLVLQLDRDWTWDALKDVSFVIHRKKRFREDDADTETENAKVGDIEIKKTVPFNALMKPQRNKTTIIFIDAVENKNERMQPAPNEQELRFPDLIELEYSIKTEFKDEHLNQEDSEFQQDSDFVLPITLPITLQPAQVPKIVAAGIALSPYTRNKKYSVTEPRRRFLWIEFDKPIKDPKDSYFARVLGYAPDQLISNNSPELLVVPEEPALSIDPEYIRVITPNQPNDEAGLDAMQLMEKAIDSNRHYLLPLPPGLHSESPEMFGFFTYEFRVGHNKYPDDSDHHDKGESVWTTAQGRFGRPLRATGIQHPAPTLTCMVNRDEEKLYVIAPYAVAVHKGKNVTSDPPRTEIWCLLYAQVKQADNKDFRNILLDDRMLDPNVRVEHDKHVKWNVIYTPEQRAKLKKATIRNWNNQIDFTHFKNVYKLADFATVNKDATKYGTVIWSNEEIIQLLTLYGLPVDSPLSILCVEILPQITNIYDHIDGLDTKEVQNNIKRVLASEDLPSVDNMKKAMTIKQEADYSVNLREPKPLSDKLGYYRILRTSALNEVPFVCPTAMTK